MSIRIEVPIAELQKYKIMIGTPMYGGSCCGSYTKSIADLTALCAKYRIGLEMHYLFNESLIPRARNYVCDEFMRSSCTHLVFIDSDIGFNANDVIGLLSIQISDPEKYNVVTAAYSKKCISWEKIYAAVNKGFADKNPNDLEKYIGDYVFNPKNGTKEIPINQPVEVMEAGTGFMMIDRRTFERYQEFYPEMWCRPDHVRTANFDGSREIMTYFDCVIDRNYTFGDMKKLMQSLADIDLSQDDSIDELKYVHENAIALLEKEKTASKRYLSEDYFFCQNVNRMGGKIWMCPWMKLSHTGSYVFGGSLADLASIGVSATADGELLSRNRNKT